MESESRHLHPTNLRSDHLRHRLRRPRDRGRARRDGAGGRGAVTTAHRQRGGPAHQPREGVGNLLRGHQPRRGRRPLRRAREEPLVRVPRAADGLVQGQPDGRRWRAERSPAHGSAGAAREPALPAPRSEAGAFGVSNEGFRGIGVRQGETYTRRSGAARGDRRSTLRVRTREHGQPSRWAARRWTGSTTEWKQYTVAIVAQANDDPGRLRVVVDGAGSGGRRHGVALSRKTWKSRANGLREDMVQTLDDLQPGLPAISRRLHRRGADLDGRYQWKTTIGDRGARADRQPLEQRVQAPAAPDYYQSFGLGFFEYFQLAEDIGAEPLPILNCGMACQFNSSELVPLDELGPYIQDALDLIEFANGPVTSTWGGKRAELGHPEPFNMKMLGVGNEQWGPQYVERYALSPRRSRRNIRRSSWSRAAGPFPADERLRLPLAAAARAEGGHRRRALLRRPTGSSTNARPLRRLRPQGAEGVHRRIRRARARAPVREQAQQPALRSPRPRS